MALDLKLGDKEFNYTYNLSYVWYKFYPDAKGMVDIEGLRGIEAEERIRYVVDIIGAHYKELLKLNPENGWGDLDSFYMWLCKLQLECLKQPYTVWEAWR